MPSKSPPAPFAARLAALRRGAGLSQRRLADAAGLSVNYVARLERGERAPSWGTVQALAAALGVEVGAFAAAG
jgi:transcriptional regulator with XRE-family HTH domain